MTAISADGVHSLALKQDGSVLAWGYAGGLGFGQCDLPVEASSGVTAIAAGAFQSLALVPALDPLALLNALAGRSPASAPAAASRRSWRKLGARRRAPTRRAPVGL